MEYGSKIKANHLKRQREKLTGAEGEPIVLLDCYPDVDVIAVVGEFRGLTDTFTVVIENSNGTSEHPIDHTSETLVGYAEIDEYVETALAQYRADLNVYAGLAAATLINMFPGHFPPLPESVSESIAKSVCGSEEQGDYFAALGAGDAISTRVNEIMGRFLKEFESPLDAFRSRIAVAYLEASSDPNNEDKQMRFLVDVRDPQPI